MNSNDKLELLAKVIAVSKTVLNVCSAYNSVVKTRSLRRSSLRPANESRNQLRFFKTCVGQLESMDPDHFYMTTRMSISMYNLLLSLLKSRLEIYSSQEAISPEYRLSITLLYLAHGVKISYIAMAYKIGLSTAKEIIYDTCCIICEVLKPEYLASPNVERFKEISAGFYVETGIPHCLGAIDGKHVNIARSKNNDSLYYNYKENYSVILIAACDHRFAFTYSSIGAVGSQSDGSVFARSHFGQQILRNELQTPEPEILPNSNIEFPYYFVANGAFPLSAQLMRPFPSRNLTTERENYNEKLSVARARIDTAFGILTSKWKVLQTEINACPSKVEKIISATVVLHNFLIHNKDTSYYKNEAIDDGLRDRLQSVQLRAPNRSSVEALSLRDTLKDYLYRNVA